MSAPPPNPEPLANPELARWFADEVQPHELALRNWLRVRFPTITDRDDLVQESFLRIWRTRANGPITSVKAFLFTTARNLALDALQHGRRETDLEGAEISSALDESANTAESVARAQELALLNEAIAALPERCRQVFTLRRLYGLPQKEIAARLGISEKTVEAQSTIAMHKCVQFFQQPPALPARAAAIPASSLLRPLASSPAPQHA